MWVRNPNLPKGCSQVSDDTREPSGRHTEWGSQSRQDREQGVQSLPGALTTHWTALGLGLNFWLEVQVHSTLGHVNVTLKETAPFGAQCGGTISITYYVCLTQETNS